MLGVLAMAAATPTLAQTAAQADGLDRLERAFWRCDHAITHGLLVGASAIECSVVYEALKARRFDGDFTALLAWWREHKQAQHAALDRAAAAAGAMAALR